MALQPVDVSTLQERVHDHLSMSLMSGAFRPGQAVTLRGIADQMGTSLMPVREAVRRLVTVGALEMPNSRSTRVPVPTVEAIDQLVAVRLLLEPAATALAAKNADAASIDNLRETQAALGEAIKAQDFSAFLRINRRLHQDLYAVSGNILLCRVIDNLWLQSGSCLTLLKNELTSSSLLENVERHDLIIDDIERHDDASAADRMRDVIADTAKLYRRALTKNSTHGFG